MHGESIFYGHAVAGFVLPRSVEDDNGDDSDGVDDHRPVRLVDSDQKAKSVSNEFQNNCEADRCCDSFPIDVIHLNLRPCFETLTKSDLFFTILFSDFSSM